VVVPLVVVVLSASVLSEVPVLILSYLPLS
jgi:hypothetical protein